MRILALTLLAFSLLVAAAPTVSAWDGKCASKDVNGGLVVVETDYGTQCQDVTVKTCHLQYYPGEPSTPVWVCDTLIRV